MLVDERDEHQTIFSADDFAVQDTNSKTGIDAHEPMHLGISRRKKEPGRHRRPCGLVGGTAAAEERRLVQREPFLRTQDFADVLVHRELVQTRSTSIC